MSIRQQWWLRHNPDMGRLHAPPQKQFILFGYCLKSEYSIYGPSHIINFGRNFVVQIWGHSILVLKNASMMIDTPLALHYYKYRIVYDHDCFRYKLKCMHRVRYRCVQNPLVSNSFKSEYMHFKCKYITRNSSNK